MYINGFKITQCTITQWMGLLIGLSLTLLSCIDDVKTNPPCFYQGMSQETQSESYELNVCCEPGDEGDLFCADYFKELGYTPATPLAYCSEDLRCRLCEIGKNCQCLNSNDCGSNEICTLIDQPDECRAAGLSLPNQEKQCTICKAK